MPKRSIVDRVFVTCLAILVTVLIAVLASLGAIDPQPLFQPNKTIGIAWDCVPVQFVPQGSPCYVEVVRVDKVRTDGWLEVTDQGGQPWLINPARAVGFAREPEPTGPNARVQ